MSAPVQVSIVIPTYNRPVELDEAIRSALAQEVPVEVLVGDDSPQHYARAVVDRIGDPRVQHVPMPEPTGGKPGLVRNHVISRARGTYLHFLDDDDVVPRGHYRRAIAELERRPGAGVLFGLIASFGVDEEQLAHERAFFDRSARRARRAALLGHWGFAAAQSYLGTMLICSAGLFRRSAVEAVGGFDPQVLMVEDVDLYARVFQRYEVIYLPDVVTIHYRIGPSLMHSNHDGSQIRQSYVHMHRQYRRALGRPTTLALKVVARTLLRWD